MLHLTPIGKARGFTRVRRLVPVEAWEFGFTSRRISIFSGLINVSALAVSAAVRLLEEFQ